MNLITIIKSFNHLSISFQIFARTQYDFTFDDFVMSGSQYWLDASPVTPPHLHSWLPRCGGIGKKTNPQGNLTRTRSALTPFGIATACTISPFFPISVERHRTARTVIECAQPRTKIKKQFTNKKKKYLNNLPSTTFFSLLLFFSFLPFLQTL